MESQQSYKNLLQKISELHIHLADTIIAYLKYMKSVRCAAANTIFSYGRQLLGFVQFCHLHHINKIEHVKPETIFAYLDQIKQQGKSRSSIYLSFCPIKTLVKFAIINGRKSKYFSQILCIQSPKVDKKLPRILTIDQVKRLLEAPQAESKFYYRDAAILELLYAAGIRATELAELRLCDLDLIDGFIIVTGKGSKQRMIPLTETAILAIQEYIDSERRSQVFKNDKSKDRLFLSRSNKPLCRHEIWRIVTKYARDIGLTGVSVHTLRHCFATHMLIGGADLRTIQKILGHSSISTTEIYTHVDITQLKKAIKKFHPRP